MHNLMRHAPMAVVVAAPDANFYPSFTTGSVLIQNNVSDDIKSANWGGLGWAFQIGSNTTFPPPYDITIDHNTSFVDQMVLSLGSSGTASNVQFTNNLQTHGVYGVVELESGQAPWH